MMTENILEKGKYKKSGNEKERFGCAYVYVHVCIVCMYLRACV